MTSVQMLFNQTSLGEVITASRNAESPREFVAVGRDASMNQCLKAMTENQVSAIPVLDNASHKVIGVVDTMDVARTLVDGLSESEDSWKSWPDYRFDELLDEIPVADAVDFNHGDPLLVSSSKSSVASVMKFFASGLAHRCIVRFDDAETMHYGVVTQVDIASWLASVIDEDAELRKPFMEISLIPELKNRSSETHEVVKALWTDSVFELLNLMIKTGVRAVALVDDEGSLKGNFSSTDLVHIDAGSVADIMLSGKDYLTKYSRWSLTPICFLDNEKANLGETLMMFSGIGLHRVWLVDSPAFSKFKPTGVFTVTDVLQLTHRHFC
eukprot:TRINITY_DN5407_c0_g1_i1.p1 TRINITY_DN5407_c0_g1~~TRINITY_DN5407_c0_g1_i1.p1  ORF type:complete len:341 (-),score=104.38 TRINITY_DN5407_c0_g1_i1:52-1029(-)